MAYHDRNKVSDIDHVAAQKATIQAAAKKKLALVQASGGRAKIALGDLDAATSGLDVSERLRIKAGLDRAGQIMTEQETTLLRTVNAQSLIDGLVGHIGGRDTEVGRNPVIISVDPRLGKALEAAEIECCSDVDRLTRDQEDVLMARAPDITTRIMLKTLINDAGIRPKQAA